MMTLRNARTLTRYMAWANDRIFAAVAALPEGEATKPRRCVFKNIVHTLNHVYVIDLISRRILSDASTASRRATRRTDRRSTSCGRSSASSTTSCDFYEGCSPGLNPRS